MIRTALAAALATFLLGACGGAPPPSAADGTSAPVDAASEARTLRIYNWSDYIAEDTIEKFEAETGIKVIYDVFDSNDVLEAKLLSGDTGYDIVVPTLNFLARQIKAGVFLELDRGKLSNHANLDPEMMQRIAVLDPGNTYSVPYLWGTTGIGYNVEKVREALGEDAPVDSWDLVFKPENVAKLAACGVSFLDAASEMIPIALHYLGEDPNSFDEAVIGKSLTLMQSVRPHLRYFHSSQYINDLANGDICVAVGWSGDIIQAATRAEEAGKGVEVAYVIPKEGAPLWFDMLAIPKSAKHPDNAHAFLNYLLRPEVIAGISDYVAYANPNPASTDLVSAEVTGDPTIYPPAETMAKLYPLAVLPPEVDRFYTRLWTTLKSGR
ncbi:MAG: extracellular solute-binding protein [Lysobacteraceae bacterium]